jgi:hypothetical protein
MSLEPREPATVEKRVNTGVCTPGCRKAARLNSLALP